MKLFENGVGRPSNETLKKRRIFIASVIIAIVAVIFVGVYALNGLNLSNLTGEARKVDVSQEYPYKEGSRIYLDNVKVYLTSKVKLLYSKKTGTYYVSSNKLENGRISITKDEKNVGNSKKIAGWITESDLIASKVIEAGTIIIPSDNNTETSELLMGDVDLNGKIEKADYSLVIKYVVGTAELSEGQLKVADMNNDGKITATDAAQIMKKFDNTSNKTNKVTSTKKTTTYKLKKGDEIVLEDVKVYKYSLLNKVKSTESGTFYIYSTIKINNRIKIASEKNGKSIGWVKVNDIKVKSEVIPTTTTKTSVTSSNIYQKYEEGTILSLVKVPSSQNGKEVIEFYRATTKNKAQAEKYIVVNNSSERENEVKVKAANGVIYSVSKVNIAGAYIANQDNKKTVYYDSLLEALRVAQEGMKVYANYDVNGDSITVNRGATLILGPNAIDFYDIVNNGTIVFSNVLYANEISGNGKFIFNTGASIELSGEAAITSTGLKFDFPRSTADNIDYLNGRSIISIKNKLAKENAMIVVDKIVVASLNNGYGIEYKPCQAETCTIDGEIVLIKK